MPISFRVLKCKRAVSPGSGTALGANLKSSLYLSWPPLSFPSREDEWFGSMPGIALVSWALVRYTLPQQTKRSVGRRIDFDSENMTFRRYVRVSKKANIIFFTVDGKGVRNSPAGRWFWVFLQ